MRASDDFPDAVGPITPSALPAASEKFTSWHTIFCSPGGATAAFCTTSVFAGGCSGIGSLRARQVARAAATAAASFAARATKPRQLAMARSTGASARPPRIEPAMMMPGVDS